MRKSTLALLTVILGWFGVHAQKDTERTFKPDTVELITPWVHDGRIPTFSAERGLKSCFDFVSLSYSCARDPNVSYGDRVGVNWDLFQINGGHIDRTRMVDVGKYDWTDQFVVPEVEPWPELLPGEKRSITVNASGGNGSAGAPGRPGASGVAGMNGDGTYTPMPRPQTVKAPDQPRLTTGKSYATANVKEQVTSTVKSANGKVRSDPYTPVVEVKKDHMYVVHVVEETHDFYVLIHVDEIDRGERVKFSYIKLEMFKL